MNSASSLVDRFRGKIRHLSSYARMGKGLADKWQLALLAWRRFDVFNRKHDSPERHWKARLRQLQGHSVHLRSNDIQHLAIFDEIFLQAGYDLGIVDFKLDVIWDVGSHIGLFSLLAATRWPDVFIYAVEPHPDNAAWARRNIAGNELRATIIEAAASSKSGWMNFNSGGGMGNLAAHGDLVVPVIDLPALMRSVPSERTLLKMDIEGEELTLLPQILPLLPKVCGIFVEIHGSEHECQSLIETIHSTGFTSRKIREKQSTDGQLRFVDLFLKRF